MEKRKKEDGVLARTAAALDLPADVLAGLSRVELTGRRELLLERHRGILAYSAESIDINTDGGVLRIRGGELTLLSMTAEELRLGGSIDAVEWL